MKKLSIILAIALLVSCVGTIAIASDTITSTTTKSGLVTENNTETTTKKTGEGLTISPPLKELTLKAGEVSKQTITITNPTKSTIEVYPSVMNFEAGGENGEPTFTEPKEEESNFALASWIKFAETKIALTPEQVYEFNYTVKAPDGAEPGGHYGAVFFAKQPLKSTDTATSNQVIVSGKIGTLILVKVPGALVEKATLDKFATHKISFMGPVNFETKITNLGNIHFKPKGEITIKNIVGNEAGRATVNEAGGNVLPDSIRKFDTRWSNGSWAFGRYVASVKLIYGDADKEVTGTYVFYLLPWWFLVAVALSIVLVVLLIIVIVRKRKHAKRKYADEKEDDNDFFLKASKDKQKK